MDLNKKFIKIPKFQNYLEEERLKNDRNFQISNTLQRVDHILSRGQELSTSFDHMDEIYDSDNELLGFYKQWEVYVYIEDNLEDDLDFILPFINYEIIFQENIENNINYYQSQDDLHISKFFEIKENALILKPSIFIKNTYISSNLINPLISLRVSLINPAKSLG